MVTMILDILLAGLLVATCVGGIKIHRKITQLQALNQEFQRALQAFDHTSQQTAETLKVLDIKAKQTLETIDNAVAGVDPIKQDLLFLCQRAERAAESLMKTPAPLPQTPTAVYDRPAPMGRSHAERELADLMAQRQAS